MTRRHTRIENVFWWLVNLGLFFPRIVWRWAFFFGSYLLVIGAALLYAAAFPFFVVYFVLTHPVFFNILRVSLVGVTAWLALHWVKMEEPKLPLIGYLSTDACLGYGIVTGCLSYLLFRKGVFKMVTLNYRPIPSPPKELRSLMDGAGVLHVPFEYFFFPDQEQFRGVPRHAPPVSEPEPVEEVYYEEPEPEVFYAEPAPHAPKSVAESTENLPPHLRDILKRR